MKNLLNIKSLTIFFILLFKEAMAGDIIFGFDALYKVFIEGVNAIISVCSWMYSGHLIQATFEKSIFSFIPCSSLQKT